MRVQFAEFTLDTEARQLFERSREVHLSPKAFELLKVLVEERPRALSKQELLDRVWPGTFVSDASLARSVSELRSALNDHSRSAGFIQTVHGFGYRFFEGRVPDAMAATFVDDELVCWLVNQNYEFQVTEGEHIIGREPGASIRLDSPRVSRTHARLVRRGRDASIEDLGSKNGTFVRGARITEQTPLQDGDEVQIGPIAFRFRIVDAPAKAPTEAWRRE
ncbi:MAG TPA: FHA domain-containing protein [Vicinamibacterales bacterium]|nr:FHA domain-containing protein [Vicinamibacterales bacterium]